MVKFNNGPSFCPAYRNGNLLLCAFPNHQALDRLPASTNSSQSNGHDAFARSHRRPFPNRMMR